MNFDRRSEVRERVRLPVCLSGGRSGLTRDVSASGLSFDFNGRLEAGSTIELSIALPDNDRPMRLKAQGMVVRVEPRGSGYGVGVRMSNSTLEQVDAAPGDCRIPAVPKTHTHRQRHWH
jgi:hypothetical protein